MYGLLISAFFTAVALLPITPEQFRNAEETIGNPESELYDETAFCEILQSALDASILDEAAAMRARYRIEMAAKNSPGSRAADFRIELRHQPGDNPGVTTLHHLPLNQLNHKTGEAQSITPSPKPILLLFYDPDCDHCMQTIARLEADTELSARVDIIAIYAEDDPQRWEETNNLLPENWTVGMALDPIQDNETYIFITSPTIYLLDSDFNVLQKDTSLEKAANYLDSHYPGN